MNDTEMMCERCEEVPAQTLVERKAFEISQDCRPMRSKGFHMTFANGWTVSVQWGSGNYCDNRSYSVGVSSDPLVSNTAEVWRWDHNGSSHGEDVRGWLTADEVAAYIAETAGFKKSLT